ncbi:hypothetical protein ScPMuIL_010077 [Solemya velum]
MGKHVAYLSADHLSFANPNYQFEDRLNSKKEDLQSPKSFDDDQDSDVSIGSQNSNKMRKKYAQLDLSTMGIVPVNYASGSNSEEQMSSDEDRDIGGQSSDTESEIQSKPKEDSRTEDASADCQTKSRGFLGYYSLLEAKARESSVSIQSPTTEDEFDSSGITPSVKQTITDLNLYINSPDSNDSGIQSDARSDDGGILGRGTTMDGDGVVSQGEDTSDAETPQSEALPPGWERCEDEDGPYYWHIKSGTLQREPPPPAPPETRQTHRSISTNSESSTVSGAGSIPSTPTSVSSEDPLQQFEGHALQYAFKSLQAMSSQQEVVQKPKETPSGQKPIRFAVQSLGWVGIAEEDLTPERSSRAVNKCIVDLSLGRNDFNDVVGRWGDGKDLYLDIDSHSLRLVDTQDFSVLNSQPIHSIRVWGVGRDNGRDFAYVARDKTTCRHMCHVFRCDTPARQIANTLRDICKKIMMERKLQQSVSHRLTRPTDLPNLEKITGEPNGEKLSFNTIYNNASFPTPMEEPKKVIRCHYLGGDFVTKPTGMDILNSVIDRMYKLCQPEKWKFVSVSVAPSTVTIIEHGKPENIIDECRVRYLSFMGISMYNIKLCSFIFHRPDNTFYAHVFHCEPSAGPLCKTVEAACKLRYQKCLDAHPQTPNSKQEEGKETIIYLKESLKVGVHNVQTGVKSGVQTLQSGVKTGVLNMQSGVKTGIQSVQNVFNKWKSRNSAQADQS